MCAGVAASRAANGDPPPACFMSMRRAARARAERVTTVQRTHGPSSRSRSMPGSAVPQRLESDIQGGLAGGLRHWLAHQRVLADCGPLKTFPSWKVSDSIASLPQSWTHPLPPVAASPVLRDIVTAVVVAWACCGLPSIFQWAESPWPCAAGASASRRWLLDIP